MSSFQLTPHQIQFMDTFGYLHLPGLLNDRIEEIDEAFEELLRLHGSDNHDGCIGTIKAVLGFVSSDLVVCSVRCPPGARL